MSNRIVIASAVLTIIILIWVGKAGADATPTTTQIEEVEIEEASEIEECKIERTKECVEVPQFYDVPLTVELQMHIFRECEVYNIPPSIIVAMIERESRYNASIIGDSGKSFGLLQIQPMWHQSRMDRLGVTDLLDPYQNVTVAIDIVAELLEENDDVYWMLMTYNGGKAYADEMMAQGTYSDYAMYVIDRATELEESR